MGLRSRIGTVLDMIKFEHTIFALPFAYMGMVLGYGNRMPSFSTFLWITLAMVGARSYAMALNRVCDRNIDRKNPRTSQWPLPRGLVTMKEALALIIVSFGLFMLSVYMLPSLCHKLWPVVIVPMTLYSLTKRFTFISHFILGLCLGLAPLGAWIAATNVLPPAGICALGLGVLLWTTGFDIIYSCQDHDFDKKEGLYSIPVHFGIPKALVITKILHGATVLLLLFMGISFSLGFIYYIGIAIIALFLLYENSIVSPDDLSRVNVSFFTVNGFVSIFAFVFTFIALQFNS